MVQEELSLLLISHSPPHGALTPVVFWIRMCCELFSDPPLTSLNVFLRLTTQEVTTSYLSSLSRGSTRPIYGDV
ncbi:hypothetical protein E2C01_057088 [Portunus trituberculatus]|uniref:Uncharacterized protein n=1 Tax=Portunus trituberculatus TaxID=210409 RepID=A0A5B7GZF0_PORTR|nr:hypothetical protein [Portunus trituberculatus]